MRFKQRHNYHFLEKQGELNSSHEVFAAAVTSAKGIEENGFLPEHTRISNVDETGLY